MRVCTVGIKRKYKELPEDYIGMFNRTHLEIPWMIARHGGNTSTITTVDFEGAREEFPNGGFLHCIQENQIISDKIEIDVQIHWRQWFEEFYHPGAINVLNCQDFGFDNNWKKKVLLAYSQRKLSYILAFPMWHSRNLYEELDGKFPKENIITNLTLGVDSEIYYPNWKEKDPFSMLWAGDPGRGIDSAIELAIRLHKVDKRFKLNVCHPDYATATKVNHPAIIWHGNVPNGSKFWDLFNKSAFLPITSCFTEPSSRCHRQGMASGAVVLYPPNMGSPSELIENGKTGIVSPINTWVKTIHDLVSSGEWKVIGQKARDFAVSENWSVQADRFNKFFEDKI